MRKLVGDSQGMGFMSVLVALLILAVLYFGYFKMQSVTSDQAVGTTAIDASRAVACRTQRQAAERDIMMWSVDHPDETPTLASLERAGVHIPQCPEGGTYSIEGKHLRCSLHDQ
jgi:hypothetical protein